MRIATFVVVAVLPALAVGQTPRDAAAPSAIGQGAIAGAVVADDANGRPVRRAVVTLSGEVNSQDKRARAEKLANGVPNVQQVVNDLQVKDQKASSSQ